MNGLRNGKNCFKQKEYKQNVYENNKSNRNTLSLFQNFLKNIFKTFFQRNEYYRKIKVQNNRKLSQINQN